MSKIIANYHLVLEAIDQAAQLAGRRPGEVTLVAVTKNRSLEEIRQLYAAGCRTFGENRLQEAAHKAAAMPADCQWHFIGTLQKNKVRKAVEIFACIESIDSVELLDKVSTTCVELKKVMPVFLQINTSRETSKHGWPDEINLQEFTYIKNLPGIRVEGLMTMATNTEDQLEIQRCFSTLKRMHALLPEIGPHLSMGMSQDFKLAIKEGATLVRIGSKLFL